MSQSRDTEGGWLGDISVFSGEIHPVYIIIIIIAGFLLFFYFLGYDSLNWGCL